MASVDLVERLDCVKRVVACPRCGSGLEHSAEARCGSYTLAASLDCPDCGPVGQVCNGKYIFSDDVPLISSPIREIVDGALLNVRPGFGPGGVGPGPDWEERSRLLSARSVSAELEFRTSAVGVFLTFLQNDWSGIVEVSADRLPPLKIDLYQPSGTSELCVPLYLGIENHRVRVRCTGRRNPAAFAAECHLADVLELHAFAGIKKAFTQDTESRGNPPPGRWRALLSEQRGTAITLDVGSSLRGGEEPRHLTMDSRVGIGTDIVADPDRGLPIRSQSISALLAQLTLNHVVDPDRAVREFERVLKAGGVVLAEAAQFQPAHDSHEHYYNLTRRALVQLFRDFDVDDAHNVGGLADTLSWVLGAFGALPDDLRARVPETIETIRRIEDHFTPATRRRCASHVEIVARKPE